MLRNLTVYVNVLSVEFKLTRRIGISPGKLYKYTRLILTRVFQNWYSQHIPHTKLVTMGAFQGRMGEFFAGFSSLRLIPMWKIPNMKFKWQPNDPQLPVRCNPIRFLSPILIEPRNDCRWIKIAAIKFITVKIAFCVPRFKTPSERTSIVCVFRPGYYVFFCFIYFSFFFFFFLKFNKEH